MKPSLICLTPVKNEAWILDRFLACAGTWADHIIIADQRSTDASREIARRHPKVRLVDNPGASYDEQARQRLLLDEARKTPGPRVLITLDADEALSANFLTSPEWRAAIASPPGTVLAVRWANLLPGFRTCWLPDHFLAFGFVDDGSEHSGGPIHSPRVPVRPGAPQCRLDEVRVLHFQYADWERMESKHRWYQCLERLRDPAQNPLGIYRMYHHMDEIAPGQIVASKPEWFAGYESLEIGVTAPLPRTEWHWWDAEVLQWLAEFGCEAFRKEAIWDVDWNLMHRRIRGANAPGRFDDPRNWLDRFVHRWLRTTQRHATRLDTRLVSRLLELAGWWEPPPPARTP